MATLKARAHIIQQIRQFFINKGLMEVETSSLCQATVTDLHLHAFESTFDHPLKPQRQTLYLQTSPEYAMKRLLCAGSGPIFQICKAYRNEEAGRDHNPEFTLLEWYRPGFDHFQLMAEMDELLMEILACPSADKITYQQAFEQHLGVDPLDTSLQELKALAAKHGYADIALAEHNSDNLLNLLFSQHVETQIAQQRPCFVYNFPASQAALARVSPIDPRVAERFEVYFKGKELANGFHELSDAAEQGRRFAQDNKQRAAAGLPVMPIDQYLLAALESGLPDCAGVALGIDRLLMLALQKQDIAEVMAFPINHA
jgi:lysyl-tRNA synthetase class 2